MYFDSVQSVFFRLRISDKKLERVVGLENINRVEDAWVGLGPDDSPLIVREIGSQEIYALDVEFPWRPTPELSGASDVAQGSPFNLASFPFHGLTDFEEPQR